MPDAFQDAVTPLLGASFEGVVTVRDCGPQGMIALRGALSDPAFSGPVTALAGCAMPERWTASASAGRALLWMSPDELLLLLPYGEAREAASRLQRELDAQAVHALVQDVSDMRVRLRLEGPRLREALARLTPADVSPAALPPGTIRRTRIAQVAALIRMLSDEEAELLCFRSVADYVFRLLSGAAGNSPDFKYF